MFCWRAVDFSFRSAIQTSSKLLRCNSSKIFCDVYYTTTEVSAFGAPFPARGGVSNVRRSLLLWGKQNSVLFLPEFWEHSIVIKVFRVLRHPHYIQFFGGVFWFFGKPSKKKRFALGRANRGSPLRATMQNHFWCSKKMRFDANLTAL